MLRGAMYCLRGVGGETGIWFGVPLNLMFTQRQHYIIYR